MATKIAFAFWTLLACMVTSDGYIVDYGPVVKATKGEIWPKPQFQTKSQKYAVVRPSVLQFVATGSSCDILVKAFDRYGKIITSQMNFVRQKRQNNKSEEPAVKINLRTELNYMGRLDSVKVNLKNPCDVLPELGMDEAYEFSMKEAEATLESFSVWGILRGLESFSQLLMPSSDGRYLILNETEITDEPRFSHRGLLIDTSRHFISMHILIQILDGMAYNKLNVFHWHIVDDHAFPYVSKRFPELSKKGAYDQSMIYSQDDVARIIESARIRGIRVMAEFDTPGHTRSWGASHPEILTECGGPYAGRLGPLSPIKDETYEFLYELFEEIVEVFPEKFVHIGGDEVGFECWDSNDDIKDYMNKRNISFKDLEDFFIQKVIDKVSSLNASSVVWQEVYENGVKLAKGTVVQVWTGNRLSLLARITKDQFPALLSSCWYLDHLSTGGDWIKFYNCDPHDFSGTEAQKKLVMGGEACMWSESVDDANILQRIFPRVSATAEKLWSSYNVVDIENAKQRLEEHYCRMKARGIPAQPPNGPGYCM